MTKTLVLFSMLAMAGLGCGHQATADPSKNDANSVDSSSEDWPECCRPPDRTTLLKRLLADQEKPQAATKEQPASPPESNVPRVPAGGTSALQGASNEKNLVVGTPSLSPPFPSHGRPAPDRVSTQDPTFEASVAAALAKTPPGRTTPAPFVIQNLPDPFENQRVGRLPSLPPEENQPVGSLFRLPRR